MNLLTFIMLSVLCFLPFTLELLCWIESVQVCCITLSSSLQIHHEVLYRQRIIPKIKSGGGSGVKWVVPHMTYEVTMGLPWHDLAQRWTDKREDRPYRLARIFFIQLHIFEDGTSSWHTDGRLKIITSMDILPPVQKGLELQKGLLKASKNVHKISPGFEFLP